MIYGVCVYVCMYIYIYIYVYIYIYIYPSTNTNTLFMYYMLLCYYLKNRNLIFYLMQHLCPPIIGYKIQRKDILICLKSWVVFDYFRTPWNRQEWGKRIWIEEWGTSLKVILSLKGQVDRIWFYKDLSIPWT